MPIISLTVRLQANTSSPARLCQTWRWASFSWLCLCSASAPASSSSSSCSTPCWRGRWLWSSRRCSTQVRELFPVKTLSAACLIVSTSAPVVMLDEQHRYSLLPAHLQVHQSCCVTENAQEQSPLWSKLLACSGCIVCSHTALPSSGLLLTSRLCVRLQTSPSPSAGWLATLRSWWEQGWPSSFRAAPSSPQL